MEAYFFFNKLLFKEPLLKTWHLSAQCSVYFQTCEVQMKFEKKQTTLHHMNSVWKSISLEIKIVHLIVKIMTMIPNTLPMHWKKDTQWNTNREPNKRAANV